MKAYTLLLIGIVIGTVGQILLKLGMSRRPDFHVRDFILLFRDPPVVGGLCCYFISTLFYFKVLATLDLSVAYPTVSLGYVLIIICSRMFFNEPVGLARILAVVIICAGVALVGLGSS
jgi:multidrug transporter EmrE-like cation transporter